MAETPYIEANLILAEQANNHAEVDRLIAELLPGERRQLADACDRLASNLRAAAIRAGGQDG